MAPEESMEAIAARLEAVRAVLQIKTRREFAERAGISQQLYSDWINLRKAVSRPSASKLVETYDLSLDFIYRGNKDALPHRIAKDL